MEAREHLCSDIALYVVVDTIRLFGKAAGGLCPSVLMKDCARECPAIACLCSHHVGLEKGELVGLVSQPSFFISWCVSFLLLGGMGHQTKNSQKFNLLQLFSLQLTDKIYLA